LVLGAERSSKCKKEHLEQEDEKPEPFDTNFGVIFKLLM
jgi:hypothetical protein